MKIIGRAERVSIAEFGLINLPAKVDTGAYSSSIACDTVHQLEIAGESVLEFILLYPGHRAYTGQVLRTKNFATTEVSNSNGVEKRFVVFAEIQVGDLKHECRFTLAKRQHLRYPILLGRRFLREAGLLVDVNQGQGLPGDEEERNL